MTNVEEIKVQIHLNKQFLQATITKIDRLESRPAPGVEEPDTTLQLDVCFSLGKQENMQKLKDLLQSKNTCKTLKQRGRIASVLMQQTWKFSTWQKTGFALLVIEMGDEGEGQRKRNFKFKFKLNRMKVSLRMRPINE
ncbi:uncharacterized protein LOC125661537 [Ostrea edulis]|uniref:uncharacterized protein LOC125661537 n=1 Tax=Ostrea edulis TaxID=37623 RepID=UPI0024AF0586|nr:uncharacterized protein LOC125661537 [Ostrea edulis]